MKKMISTILSLVMLACCINIAPHVNATDTETIDTSKAPTLEQLFASSPLVQQLEEEYGELTPISQSTVYYVTEYYASPLTAESQVSEFSNNIQTIVKCFNEYPSAYIANLQNKIAAQTVEPGGTTQTDYSVIGIQLALSKIGNTSRYHLFSYFQWLKLPSVGGALGAITGISGIAVASQLSIDRTSVEGVLGYTHRSNNENGYVQTKLPINKVTLNGVGGTFRLSHSMYDSAYDYITSLSGQVSCIAYKSNPTDEYCSGMACYTDLHNCLSVSDFSISYPLGISATISLGTSETQYNHMDALHLT